MKKYSLVLLMVIAIVSCNDAGNNTTKTNATANDSNQHPNGMTDASAISTDTAAMRTDTTHR